jgi:glucokinase
MNPTAIGIDFGGTTVKFGVVQGGRIIARMPALVTRDYPDHALLLKAIRKTIEELREHNSEVAAIGAGLPGMIDTVHGRVYQLSNVPGWEDVPLTALLEEWTGLPAAIDNDANAMAYAEWLYGAGHGGVNVVCVTLGTGVGGGLILDGKLYRGSQLGAGEIGQMMIDPDGPKGQYGNDGALEKYVGHFQITERAQMLYHDSGLTKSRKDCSPEALQAAADAGDEIARKVWEEVGCAIAITLCNIVWLLNPDRIVVGGGVANAGEYIFGPIRRVITGQTMKIFHESLTIVPAKLGNDAGIIGGAALALEKRKASSA